MDGHALALAPLRVGLALLLMAASGAPVRGQARATAPCTARIRALGAADYDLSAEVVLRGRVVGKEGGILLLRLAAGLVRVDVGSTSGVSKIPADASIEVLGSKCQEGGRQRLLAREIRLAEGLLVFRDEQGRLLSGSSQL